jgi:hypothetical protein
MSLDERAGDPFNKRPRQGDFVPRDNFQPSEIAVRRLVGRIDVHGNVGGELMIRCAVAGVPRARIVLALSLGPRETHDDRQLCATEGAGGIVPIEANATEGIVVLDPTVNVSLSDNRRAMDLKPMARRSNDVTGLMKRRTPLLGIQVHYRSDRPDIPVEGIVTSSVFTAHYLPHGRTRIQ